MSSGEIHTIPQHGVRGRQRTEPWLSLEDDDQLVRRLIARLAYEIYDSTHVGNPAPVVEARLKRMRGIRPGDLVVETTAMIRASLRRDLLIDTEIDYICKGVGYLLLARDEPSYEEGEWDEKREGRPMPLEDVYFVQYGPDPTDVCRWYNCSFVAIDIGKRAFGELEFS